MLPLPLLLALSLPPVVQYAASSGFDLAATEWALSANSSAYETNPLMQTRGRRLLLKSVQVGGLTLMSHKLKRRHPKWEKALRWTAHGVNLGLGAWAIHQGRRRH